MAWKKQFCMTSQWMKRDAVSMNGYRTSEDSADKSPNFPVMSGTGFCTLQDKTIKIWPLGST